MTRWALFLAVLVLAGLAAAPAVSAPRGKGNADLLDGFNASRRAKANAIPVLDRTGRLPRAMLPVLQAGPAGPQGAPGPQGLPGQPGAPGRDGADAPPYTAGTGLALSALEFSLDTAFAQRRVTGACDPGSSIRAIAQDGTVVCETDDVGRAAVVVTSPAC